MLSLNSTLLCSLVVHSHIVPSPNQWLLCSLAMRLLQVSTHCSLAGSGAVDITPRHVPASVSTTTAAGFLEDPGSQDGTPASSMDFVTEDGSPTASGYSGSEVSQCNLPPPTAANDTAPAPQEHGFMAQLKGAATTSLAIAIMPVAVPVVATVFAAMVPYYVVQRLTTHRSAFQVSFHTSVCVFVLGLHSAMLA